ncbi:hypothetical protein ACFE04_011483 [Oxalis oulophora]
MDNNQYQVLAMRIKGSFKEYQQPSSECSIFKVPIQQRRENDDSYEPHMLAIGPFHRGIDRLQAMEVHKRIYLNLLLNRMEDDIMTTLIGALKGLEKRARKSYAEHVSLESDDFVEMMLLDGCFIIELLRKNCIKSLIKTDDLIFKGLWMIYSLKRDMLLLENQLPFIVLLEIYKLTKVSSHEEEILKEIDEQKQHQITIALRDKQEVTVPLSEDGNMSPSSLTSTKCLQHLIRTFFEDILPGSKFSEISNGHKHLLDFVHKSWHYPKVKKGKHEDWGHIRCATELQEAGISFRKSKNPILFEITFQNGILEIPEIVIENRTESFLRNLIAYEQCSLYEIPIYIFDYVIVMDRLINSEKDVELLRRRGIIENTLGNDEVVAKMFNRMCNFVVISGEFRYLELFRKVNEHCHKRCNIWMAKLRHNYFNSPWALISFMAAVIILLLTSAQTNYSVLTYYQVGPK